MSRGSDQALIVGAGIAGLSSAITLQAAGWDTHIFEAAPAIEPVGAGIWLSINAMNAFEKMGVAEEVKNQGCMMSGARITDARGATIQEIDFLKLASHFGHSTVAIHRADLLDILLRKAGEESVSLGRPFKDHRLRSGKVQIDFDESLDSRMGDVLIGADGIHSAVRKTLFPKTMTRYSGQTCWRGVTNFDLPSPLASSTIEAWGGRERFGFSPIASGRVYWFAVRKEPENGQNPPGFKRGLEKIFERFASPIPELITATAEADIIRNDLHDIPPNDKWTSGPCLLIGDAAHSTTPNLGQGGAQAVLDAYYLGKMLKPGDDVIRKCREFVEFRYAETTSITNLSYLMGKIAHWENAIVRGLRNSILRMVPAHLNYEQLKKLYTLKLK